MVSDVFRQAKKYWTTYGVSWGGCLNSPVRRCDMGFNDFLQPVLIVGFTDPSTGRVDWPAFREDLRGKLLTDHVGFSNGIGTVALTRYYCKRTDMEACLVMERELQASRAFFMDHGIILRNASRRWHIVDNASEALGFIANRTMRVVRAYVRTKAVGQIASLQYPQLAKHAVLQTLGAAEPSIKKLEEATKKYLSSGQQAPPSP